MKNRIILFSMLSAVSFGSFASDFCDHDSIVQQQRKLHEKSTFKKAIMSKFHFSSLRAYLQHTSRLCKKLCRVPQD